MEYKIHDRQAFCQACLQTGCSRACSQSVPAYEPLVPVIPDGHLLAPSLTVWLEVDAYLVDRSWRRRDWLRNYHLVGEALAANVTAEMVTQHGMTWETLAADAGVSRSTMADRLRWRREHGLLATITTGSTVRTRKGNLWGRRDDGLGNLAAEYALIVPETALAELYGPDWADILFPWDGPAEAPGSLDDVPWPVETVLTRPEFSQVSAPVEETRTPAVAGVDLGESTLPHARENQTNNSKWPLHVTPRTKRDRIHAAERLREEDLTLRHLSARDLARLCRPLFSLGATLADAHHALNTHPLHGQWAHPSSILSAGQRWRARRQIPRLRALLEARVAAWIGPDAQLVAKLPSQHKQALRDDRAAEPRWLERQQRACAQPDPVVVPHVHVPSLPGPGFAALRAALEERVTRAWAQERRGYVPPALARAQERARQERRERIGVSRG
ncbi:hypothetical protein ABZ470_39675 [Streptosporangium sp. NPDC020072]|uniref:hypothetical protein n=1 Tax=Streptosporangium sp. NPDC020072 TaxID=3154788 RepID=UPI00343CF97C